MSHVELTLLGVFQMTRDQQMVEGFESSKVRALLAYLTVEYHSPIPRDALADLLWPGQSSETARNNFRRALANLRSVIGDRNAVPPCLLVTRETTQFNLAAEMTVDVVRFLDLVKRPETEPVWVDNLEQAIALYRGSFLEGLHLDKCPEFELWATSMRNDLERLAGSAFHKLAHHYHICDDIERALPLFRQSLALNPYNEEAQRELMVALATTGQRGAALAHYATYRHELQDELTAEPEAQTVELALAIQQGRFETVEHARPTAEARPVVFASQVLGTLDLPFAGRTPEIAALHACARQVAQGRGGVVFVTGEAGSGKTFLLHEFARQLDHSNPPWLVVLGNCTAPLGIGDLFQPFVDGLRMLTDGEIATPGVLPGLRSHTVEIPSRPSETARLLREYAPDWARLALASNQYSSNAPHSSRPAPSAAGKGPLVPTPVHQGGPVSAATQVTFFDQLTRFLERQAWRRPLLLILDNLHWADTGTIALLFHLAQHLSNSRLLIVGAYRPGALALVQGRGHALGPIVQALRHQSGATMIDLDQADGRRFVDALLDREPNQLDAQFRESLYRHTEGHALFTAELLQSLAAAGHISKDHEGRWGANGALAWDGLPSRVEALILERVEHLDPDDRGLLNAACIQGDEFRAEVIAAICGVDERAVVERLSGNLTSAHRLVRSIDGDGITENAGARYRFRHHLFQAYLYSALDDVQRVRLHRAVGLELERLYEESGHDSAARVSVQVLAWHFERGGERIKAIESLRASSRRAMEWHAYAEAASYLSKALALAPAEDHKLRFELLTAREQAHGLVGDHQARSEDIGELERLAELTQVSQQRLIATLRRATLAQETTHYAEAIAAANAALALSAAIHDPLAEMEGHRIAGRAHWYLGELEMARRHYVYALHKARMLPAPEAICDCLLHLGVACWSMDDLAGAETAFGEAMNRAAAPEAQFLRAAALMGLGMVAWTSGDYTRSEGMLDAALIVARELRHSWLEGQVLLNQLALYRLSTNYDRFVAIHNQLNVCCQAIDDRWTLAASQIEAAAFFVHLGAWTKAHSLLEQAAVAVDALGALLLRTQLLHLKARQYLVSGEPVFENAAAEAQPLATKLGSASILAESWLLIGLDCQRKGLLEKAADAFDKARATAQGEAAQRLMPEIVAAQAQLALAMGDVDQALACVYALLADSISPRVEQGGDPVSLYLICYRVMDAAGQPRAEQMLERGIHALLKQAAMITDIELRRSFCEDIPLHRELLAIYSALDRLKVATSPIACVSTA